MELAEDVILVGRVYVLEVGHDVVFGVLVLVVGPFVGGGGLLHVGVGRGCRRFQLFVLALEPVAGAGELVLVLLALSGGVVVGAGPGAAMTRQGGRAKESVVLSRELIIWQPAV